MLAHIAGPASAVRAHEELFGYWASLRAAGRLPGRRDIDPGRFKRHLPTVSLIDVRRDPLEFRIRLAGTGLYGVFGREITGLALEQVHGPAEAAAWRRELTAVAERGRPGVGLTPLAGAEASGLSVMWLRLPLASDGRTVDMILGYDAVIGSLRSAPTGIRAA